MSSQHLRLLLIEDSEIDAAVLELELKRAGFRPDVTRIETEQELRVALRDDTFDLLVADYNLPSFSGMEALRIVGESDLDLPFFLISGTVGEERAVEAMRAGAHDYLLKDNLTRLGPAVTRELREAQLRKERHANLERLVASERRFISIFQNSPVAIMLATLADGLVYDVNPAALSLVRCNRTEIVGRPAELFGAWPTPSERQALMAETAHHGQTFERELLAKDGDTLTVLASFGVIELDDAARFIVTLKDISDRKRAEETLRESEQRFRMLVENSNDLITEITLDGAILYTSPNHGALTGYEAKDLVGHNVLEFVHPDDLEEVAAKLSQRKAASTFRYRFRDGSFHWFEASGSAFQLNDQTERGVIVSRDVTERIEAEQARRELEDQLRKAQRIEALGTLAGGIAHDFNNILAAIVAYTEMAGQDADNPVAVREHVAELTDAGKRATDLVKQILAFSRHRKHSREPISLAVVVNDALKLLRSTLPATIEIVAQVEDDNQIVLADPGQIHQVVMNLCTNAAHAVGESPGRISVELGAHEVDVDHATQELGVGRYVRLSVTDTGHGMDASVLERIFEPFFTTKAPGEGTGLGLAVVHGIVRDHEGVIRAHSTLGQGSTFDLYFPEHRSPGPQSKATIEGEPRGQGERVLFVDDEPSLCRGVGLMLQRLGYHVTGFTSPEEALRHFEAHGGEVDIVLTDLSMPGMTGIEFSRRLLAQRSSLPILLLSGFSGKWTPERVAEVGLSGVVAKPLSSSALANALRRALDRPRDRGDRPRE